MVLRIWGFVYRGLGGDPLLSTAVLLLGHAGPWEEGTWAFEQSLDLLSEAQGSPMEVLGWQWSCTCSKHSVFPGMQALAHVWATGVLTVFYCQVTCAFTWVTEAFRSSLAVGSKFLSFTKSA